MAWRHMLPKGEMLGSLYLVATRERANNDTPQTPSKVPSVLATQAHRGRRGIRKDEPDAEMGESLAQEVARTRVGRF
jgi:hypothetical protein